MQLHDILRRAHEHEASDIHIVPGHPPMMRVHTVLVPMDDFPTLTSEAIRQTIEQITTPSQQQVFDRESDLDFSHEVPGLQRYRINAHLQRSGPALALRSIRTSVPPMESLGLPEIIDMLVDLPRGLVLVTGDTGSGKSTTLAAMIDAMNRRHRKHIVTLEDPVEYTFTSDLCLIEQRELGADMPTFASGMRHALRQDPDVILVGEMRDLETAALAISAAETGHLVLSTLHTASAAQTVERIIDMYPAGQQAQIRAMLSNTLEAVVSQTLFSRADRPGMVPAVEVLLCTPAVRNLIREDRTFEIPNVIETSRQRGMNSLDSAISELYFNGCISREDALEKATNRDKLERQLAA
ncbi:MAG: type IV pilus twitching motility protein PilT [Phycisphaerales bacterium]|jgi:twitching motility protein PilT|nr:type IV pilus twitching motility protein PilT [Planctomycetota bacterium]